MRFPLTPRGAGARRELAIGHVVLHRDLDGLRQGCLVSDPLALALLSGAKSLQQSTFGPDLRARCAVAVRTLRAGRWAPGWTT